ncbi:MAG: rhamnogalacturonan acetylesterase [Clostridia bacterium]|nr:rhamnogalacturonan acetylesterase [Clostridia bacterium]
MPAIFWIGDSTVQHNSLLTYPQTGIGQVFDRFIRTPQAHIENHARNGRSTKSFLEEGRLAPVCQRLREGDFLFIQFGHNDQKQEDPARYAPADTAYADNLRLFIRTARLRGATPVLITPLTRCNHRQLPPDRQFAPWVAAMKRVGEETGTAVIDLTRMSEELVDRWGETAAQDLYMTLPAGRYPAYPDGLSDKTHLQPLGAINFAALIANGLYQLGGAYAELLCEGYRPDPDGGRISL